MEQWGDETDTADIDDSSGIGGYYTMTPPTAVEFASAFPVGGEAVVIIGQTRGATVQLATEGRKTTGFIPRYRTILSVTGETIWYHWYAIGRWY